MGEESISLSAFGAQTSARRNLSVATIQVVASFNEQIPINVLVIYQIAAPLQLRSRNHIQNIPHLQGVQLAHPVIRDESFEISLLIGADHYWDEIICGDGTTAMRSKLDYLLSGPLQSASLQEPIVTLLHVMVPP